MIDRILVAAYDAGLDPLLVLTKSDLADPDGLMATYRPLGLRVVAVEPGSDLTELREALSGHRSVLVGHSGVGKSTLVNALIPGVDRQVGVVNDVTGRGRHTSTSVIALQLPDGAWVIDASRRPLVRTQSRHRGLDRGRVRRSLRDRGGLPPRLPARLGRTQCALDLAVADGRLPPERLESFRRMEKAFG